MPPDDVLPDDVEPELPVEVEPEVPVGVDVDVDVDVDVEPVLVSAPAETPETSP